MANELIFNPEFPQLQNQPADIIPPADRGDITVDEERLKNRLLELFWNDVQDKDEYGWGARREYDIVSYYAQKNEALKNWPYKGASSFRMPLTPTLVDTAVSNVKASIWSINGDSVKVTPQSPEDVRIAPILQSYLNHKVNNEIDMEPALDSTIFRSFHNGTSFLKVIRDFQNRIKVYSLNSENCYLPIDANGVQKDGCDRVTQIIPLTYNDVQMRRRFYRDIDKVSPGVGLGMNSYVSTLVEAKDRATGTDLTQKYMRETYFIAETYITYFEENSMRPKELIVWWSPNGLIIHRVRTIEGQELRPFADFHSYPNAGRFWSMSLPEKIRGPQESLDYAHKQNIDALDRAISPAMFLENTDDFNPNLDQRKPAGVYKIGQNNKVFYEPQPPVERGFERMLDYYWLLAERMTGIIDITQGSAARQDKTLGQTEIRTTRADVRFQSVLDRFERGWAQVIKLGYDYCNRYESREKKLRVIGYNDFKTLKELFPNDSIEQGLGLKGTYDFGFGGTSVIERENEKLNAQQRFNAAISNPHIANDPVAMWKFHKEYDESLGYKNFESLWAKPKGVNIYSPEEFIQRVMSGQIDIQVRPGIDTDSYVFELQLFMKTESFEVLDMKQKMTLMNALRQAYIMGVAERQAMLDANAAMQQIGAQKMMMAQAENPPKELPEAA